MSRVIKNADSSAIIPSYVVNYIKLRMKPDNMLDASVAVNAFTRLINFCKLKLFRCNKDRRTFKDIGKRIPSTYFEKRIPHINIYLEKNFQVNFYIYTGCPENRPQYFGK